MITIKYMIIYFIITNYDMTIINYHFYLLFIIVIIILVNV